MSFGRGDELTGGLNERLLNENLNQMQDNFTTYRGIRIDDTAEWRMVVNISSAGMSAYLRNIENPLEPLMVLFEEGWSSDSSGLLRRIEKCVYDHPQLMDDFSTDIIVTTSRALWVPERLIVDEDSAWDYYCRIYDCEPEDVFVDNFERYSCVYSLTPGLSAFLRRTLSGAKVMCHQSVLVNKFACRGVDSPRLYVDIREGSCDFILVDEKKLLLSSTHCWSDPMDISYMIFNIIDLYGLSRGDVQVSLSGLSDVKRDLLQLLREHLEYVMLTMVPTSVSKDELPMSTLLMLSK